MSYKLNLGSWNRIFAVPTVVAENFLKTSNEVEIKTLLYFLSHAGESFSITSCARTISAPEDEIKEALIFWENVSVLKSEGGETFVPGNIKVNSLSTSDTVSKDLNVGIANELNEKTVDLITKAVTLKRTLHISRESINELIKSRPDVKYLFEQCGSIFGLNDFTHSRQETIFLMIEEIGLPPDCVLMLVKYCKEKGITTPYYLKKVALLWIEKGIVTSQKAIEEIERFRKINPFIQKVKNRLNLTDGFSEKQTKYIEKWFLEFKYDEEIIFVASEKSLDNNHKISFPYMDKIMENWYNAGIKTPEEAENSKAPGNFSRGKTSKTIGKYKPQTKEDDMEFPESAYDMKDF